jgi:hypothetical protein
MALVVTRIRGECRVSRAISPAPLSINRRGDVVHKKSCRLPRRSWQRRPRHEAEVGVKWKIVIVVIAAVAVTQIGPEAKGLALDEIAPPTA